MTKHRGTRNRISLIDENILIWALTVGITRFFRSKLGPQLDSAQVLYAKSPRYDWNEIAPEFMAVKETYVTHVAAPDDTELTAYAYASRWMRELTNIDPFLALLAEVYYGNVGSSWAATDNATKGRDIVLLPFTETGKQILASDPNVYDSGVDDPIMRIDNIVAIHRLHPTQEQRMRLQRMNEEAGQLRERLYRGLKAAIQKVGSCKVPRGWNSNSKAQVREGRATRTD